VIERVALGIPVVQACREAGISRTLFYRWKRRYLQCGDAGLAPYPTQPRRWARQSPAALERAVLAYALRQPTRGPQHIADQLAQRRYGGWEISATGVYKVLRRHGLGTRWERLARLEGPALVATGLLSQPDARWLGKARQIPAERPGDLVCLHTFYVGKLKGVGRLWQLTACDAAVSYGIAHVLLGRPCPGDAARFLAERVLPEYRPAGHGIRAVRTDRGPEWREPFGATCRAAGIEHRHTHPWFGWRNGFVDLLQGTILTELWRAVFRQPHFSRAEQLEWELQRYLRFYNQERRLGGRSMHGMTPSSLFHRRAR